MKSSLSNILAAPDWARPSARQPRPFSLALRALALALLAVIAACALAPRAEATTYPTVYSFTNTSPAGAIPAGPPVIDNSGNVWGMTDEGGASGVGIVYEFLKGKTTPTTVHSFSTASTDGEYPVGGLCLGRDGNLYGTTYNGGTAGEGCFFVINSTTGVFTKLLDFGGACGSTNTTIPVTVSGTAYTTPANPSGTPILGPTGDNTFYLTAPSGGTYSDGAVIAVTTSGTAATTSASYYSLGKYTADGYYPYCTLCLATDGNLYGTTYQGGTGSYGTIFKIARTLAPAATVTIASMNTLDANLYYPYGGVVQGTDGFLYGTAASGKSTGSAKYGGAWKVSTSGTGYLPLYYFAKTNAFGSTPYGNPFFGSDGALYGLDQYTTNAGGYGTIYRLSATATTASTVNPSLYTFTDTSPDGAFGTAYSPNTYYIPSLFESTDLYYYGTTSYGGSSQYGTIFRFGPPTTGEATYFTATGGTVTPSMTWSDPTLVGVTDNAFSINGGAAATSKGTLSRGGGLSGTTVPTSPITATYVAGSTAGLDTFYYTVSNSLFGTSPTTTATGFSGGGLISIYIGSITPVATPMTVTGTTTALSVGGTFPSSTDTTLKYAWTYSGPTGATFSATGTNAAKSATMTFTKAGSYIVTLTVTAPDGTIYAAGTVTVTVTATAATLTVSPASATIGASSTVTLTASGTDQFGNAVTPSVTWSAPAGSFNTATSNPTIYTSSAVNPSTTTVTATSGSLTATSVITVNTPVLTANPTYTVSGATINLMAGDNVTPAGGTTTYAWSTTSGGVTFSSTTAENPTATVTGPGTYNFQVIVSNASATPTSVTKTLSVTITTAVASITISPTTLTAYPGGPSTTFTAVVKDQFGNTLTGQSLTWGVAGAAAGSITTGGVYSVPANKGTGANQTDTVTAKSGTVTSNTATVTVSEGTVSFTTAAFATPSTVTATTTSLSATATWSGGGSLLSYQWVHDTSQGSTTPVTFSDGSTDFSNLTVGGNTLTATFTKAGSYYFYVAAVSPDQYAFAYSPPTTDIKVTVSQTATGVTITPSPASVNPSSTVQLTASLTDQFGNAMTGTVTWSVVSGGASGSVNSSGLFTATATQGTTVVMAAVGTHSATDNVTVAPTPPVFTTPAEVYSPDGGVGYTTGPFDDVYGDTYVQVKAVATYSGSGGEIYSWSATGPASVTFSVNNSATANNPNATFTVAGTYTITVKATGGNGLSATSSITVTIEPVGTTINVTPVGPIYIGLGGTQQFTAVDLDQFNNVITNPSLSWNDFSNNTISNTGLYTGSVTVSNDNVYVYDNNPNSFAFSNEPTISVKDPAPTVATEISGTTSTGLYQATTGTTTSNLSVLGQWYYQTYNLGESNLTYNWASSGAPPPGGSVGFSVNGTNAAKNTVATFGAAGTYYIYVVIKAPGTNKTVQDPVAGTYLTVTVTQTLTSIVVSPSSATMAVGGTQTFTATGYDQFGNVMSTPPTITWSTNLGTINSSGLYTGTTPGTGTVTAKSGSISGTATVTVNDAAPVLGPITVVPNPITGTSGSLSVTGTYAGPGNLTYAWSEVSGPAAVSFSGGTSAMPGSTVTTTALFTASGSYKVQVVATDTQGTSSAPATLTFTVNSTFAALKCSPNPVSVPIGGTQQFSAIAYDQFGVALASQPTITWTVANSGGANSTIGTAGLLSAGTVPGSAVVTASGTVGSLTFTDTSAVTITDVAPTLGSITVNPNPVTGTTATFTVTGTYVGTGNLTYAWSGTGPGGVTFTGGTSGASGSPVTATGTFVHAGNGDTVTVIVSDASGATATQTVTFDVRQTETSIVITPNPGSVALNGTLTLTAKAYDQFGVSIVTQPTFTWSLVSGGAYGSITAGGVFTATGTPGTATISVTGSTVTTQGTVQVINQPPTVATAASANPNPVTGTTTALSVLGAYVGTGGESALTYTWAEITGPAGVTFAPNGTNAAKASTATFPKDGTYDLRVTITDTAGGTTSSDVTVTVNQTLKSVAVTPSPDTETIGAGTQQFTAVAKDQFGNALNTQPTFTWSDSGVGSVDGTGLFTIGTTPGTATLTASSGGVSGHAVVTVNDVAPTVATAASANPNPVTSGTTTALSVLGQYTGTGGESNLSYTWSATGPASVTFSDNGDNSAKNTTATFTQIGTYTFTATIADSSGGSTTSVVTVVVKSAHALITVTPNPASVGVTGTVTFSATTTDQFGNTLSSQAYTWSVPSGGGTLSATSGSSVIYTAPGTPGSATVEVVNHEATTDVPVTITDVNPTLGSITVNPSPVTGTTATFTVTGTYPGDGNLTYVWSTSGTPPAPVAFSGGTSGASGSSVTATGTFSQAGTYTIKVTVSDASGATATKTVTVTVAQTATSITVGPTPVSVTDGTTQQFTASVSDQFGNPLTTQPTFTWSVSSGSGSIDSSGLYTAPTLPGSSTVKVVTGSLSATAAVTNVDAAPTVATAAKATPNPVTTGTTTSLSVLGAYIDGESDLTYTWTAPNGSGVTFSVNGTNAAKNTVATFTSAGTYILNVTITDPSGTTTSSSVTVTVDSANGTVAISPSPGSDSVGGTLQLSAVQNDQFGNPLTPQPTFTWSVTSGGGSVNSSGLFTAPLTTGTSVVKATSSNGQSASVTITTGDVAPTIATAASATPNPVTATTTNLSVTAAYAGDSSTLTYTWAYTGPSGVTYTGSANGTNGGSTLQANFTQAGTYVFTVTVANTTGQSVASSVTVTVNQTLTNVVVTPSTASIAIGTTQQFTATAYDQFGNALSPQPTFTWTVPVGTGTVNSNGLYAATLTPGSATVKATTGSFSDTAAVTVTDTPVTVATAASATPNPVTGATTNLSVLGAWNGGESNLSYSWSATGPASVTFSINGTNAAKNTVATFSKAGSYTFTVTITDGYGGSATSTVNVTVNATATTLTISPTSASLSVGGTKQFTATATDQFGNAISPQPTFTWTVSSGPGSVSSSGLYTASTTTGTAIVKVTAGSQSATATVTVTDVAPTVATAASASPNPVTGTTTNLTVLGAYAGGESNLTYTWSMTSGPASVVYSANGTNAAKSTTVTFTQAGSYTFLVTIATPSGLTATSSVTVTVNQTATTFTVSPSTATVVVNGTQQVTAILLDQFGNAVSPAPTITWTVTSGGGTVSTSGLFTAPNAAGTSTVKAVTGSYSGTSTITITDGPPSITNPASATPNPVTGTTTALSVLGAYIGGESTLTYTWSATGPAAVTYSVNGTNASKNTTATFTQAGSYTFTVTIKSPSGLTTTSTVTVTVNQTPTSVSVTPNPASVGAGGTVQLTATSKDQFGAAISPSPTFTWSVASGGGSVSSSGLYTAPGTTGSATVKATAGSASGTATVNIIAAGTLNGTVSTSSAAVNLTTEGTLDWDHWGRAVPGLDQKTNGNLITGYTNIGSGTVGAYRTDKRPLSWTNGTPTASSTSNITGVYVAGQGNGFQIKSPASGTTRTLVVYVGGNGAGGTLTATMSDGSTGTYSNTQPTQTGVWDAEYTFTYAATAGATLNVSWVQSTTGTGSVTLSAATLH